MQTWRLSPWTCFTVLALLLSAWFLQDTLFLNWDVSWLSRAAERYLAGASYQDGFFETNPPLILYLYMPPLWLQKVSGISFALLFRAYIFLLAFVSIGLSLKLLGLIYGDKKERALAMFLPVLLVVELILPLHEFGQRDHLMLILTLPYILLLAYRLSRARPTALFDSRLKKDAGSRIRASGMTDGEISIGLMAALGLALKPHFFWVPLLLEAYAILKTRSLKFMFRPEVLVIIAFQPLYLLAIIYYFPDYLHFIVPLSLRHYYDAVASSWLFLITQPLFILAFFPLLLTLLLRLKQSLAAVLALSLIAFLLSYLTQRTVFYYHQLPFYALSLLLLTAILNELLPQKAFSLKHLPYTLLLLLTFFAWPFYQGYHIYQGWASYPKKLAPLVQLIHERAEAKPIFFFVSTTVYTFPVLDQTSATLASRLPFMWLLSGIVNKEVKNGALDSVDQEDQQLLKQIVAEDFSKEKPELVFVDAGEKKPYIHQEYFDYLNYFSQNTLFAKEWQHYRYLKTVQEDGLYTLRVYQRQPEVGHES